MASNLNTLRQPPLVRDVAVLGGGLAGLAAGMRGGDIFEAGKRVGGVAASDSVEGFTFDRGIHILQSRNQKILKLIDDLGIEMATRNRDAHIYSHGRYMPYPFQINTANLPLPLRIRCVREFLARARNANPTNYEEWMHRTLGRGFAETFLIPYSEKFWGIPPCEMTYEWTGNRIPKPSVLQVLRGALWNTKTKIGTNATFKYPLHGGGYGTLPEALARRVGEIHLEQKAVALDALERRVRFESGLECEYRVLVNTIPLPALIDIITSPVPDKIRAAASRLRTNSIYVVNLGIDRPSISNRHWLHFPEKNISFFRISYPHNFDSEVTPPGMSSISAEVAYSKDNPVCRETIVDRVIADLVRVGAMRENEPIVVRETQDIPLAYCIYDVYRKDAVRIISTWLRDHDIITCGRYGLWSYFWSDESMASGLNAGSKARKRIEELTQNGTGPLDTIESLSNHH